MSGKTRQKLIEYIEQKGIATGPELARHLGVTRQAVSLHLRQLINEGEVVKTGSTKAARYFPGTAKDPLRTVSRDLKISGLDESVVYEDVSATLSLSRLSDSVESIFHYAFTEILNNAIDHSMCDRCKVEAGLDSGKVTFNIRDKGIGVFHSISEKFGLQAEHDAMIELVKGKTTTKPDAHSGEGIFFVSRVADRFTLRSHRLQIEWDKRRDDVFVSEPRFLTGTLVSFEIGRHSRTKLENVFAEYAPEEYDYRFEKTRVLVKLLRREYVSRSEAKRLMHNLDKFSEIELDMRDVTNVGQGFADEVFRVFASAHPDISIHAINANDAVRAMISHVAR